MKLNLRNKVALKIFISLIAKGLPGSDTTIDQAFIIADRFLEKIKPKTEHEKIDFSKTNIA